MQSISPTRYRHQRWLRGARSPRRLRGAAKCSARPCSGSTTVRATGSIASRAMAHLASSAARVFPYDHMFKWLSYGHGATWCGALSLLPLTRGAATLDRSERGGPALRGQGVLHAARVLVHDRGRHLHPVHQLRGQGGHGCPDPAAAASQDRHRRSILAPGATSSTGHRHPPRSRARCARPGPSPRTTTQSRHPPSSPWSASWCLTWI